MRRVTWFFIWTIVVSWALWLPIVLLDLNTTGTVAGAVLFLLGGFGPSAVGAVFILRSSDSGGRRVFLGRTFSFSRIPIMTLTIAVLAYPALFMLSAGLNVLIGGNWPEFAGFAGMVESVPAFLGGALLTFTLGPFSEEIGWRGFALPRLQSLKNPLSATLTVGFVWWAWHIPLFFMDGTLHATQGFFSAFSVGYLITVLSYSVFFTWLYNQTKESIAIAIIAHFSINMMISGASPFDGNVFAIMSFVLLGAALLLILLKPVLGYAPTTDATGSERKD